MLALLRKCKFSAKDITHCRCAVFTYERKKQRMNFTEIKIHLHIKFADIELWSNVIIIISYFSVHFKSVHGKREFTRNIFFAVASSRSPCAVPAAVEYNKKLQHACKLELFDLCPLLTICSYTHFLIKSSLPEHKNAHYYKPVVA